MVVDGLHHVGCATTDAFGLADRYADLFDLQIAHEEHVEGMHVVFLAVGDGYLELLEPTAEEGPVAQYLADHGAGLHHVAVETRDIDRALARARECGVDPIDETPRDGAWGHEVAFLHPRDTGGILVEFVSSER